MFDCNSDKKIVLQKIAIKTYKQIISFRIMESCILGKRLNSFPLDMDSTKKIAKLGLGLTGEETFEELQTKLPTGFLDNNRSKNRFIPVFMSEGSLFC